jgi:hypothetical protein
VIAATDWKLMAIHHELQNDPSLRLYSRKAKSGWGNHHSMRNCVVALPLQHARKMRFRTMLRVGLIR